MIVLNRRSITFAYLLASIVISWGFNYFFSLNDYHGTPPNDNTVITDFALFSNPVFLGVSLVLSNRSYLKNSNQAPLIPIIFLLIFIFGTIPFHVLGGFIFNNKLGLLWVGFVAGLSFVALTTKIFLKQTKLGLIQCLLILLFLPILSLFLLSIFYHQPLTIYLEQTPYIGYYFERFYLLAFIIELSMAILISSMIENTKAIKLSQ